MYPESRLNQIVERNNINIGSSILNFERDPSKTSAKYKATDDVQVIELLNDLGWYITTYRQVKPHDPEKGRYKKYLATFTNPDLPLIGKKQGALNLLAKNSKDGISSLEFYGGISIFACLNGLVTGQQLVTPVKIRHKGDLPNQITTLVDSLVHQLPLIGEKVNEMSAKILTESEARQYAREAIELRFEKDACGVKEDDVLKARRVYDDTMSLFNTYNRVQEAIFRPDKMRYQRSDGKMTTARPITNVDQHVNLNMALWDLTEQYLAN